MKRNGFTLIELIFVIVIIGVLAAVAIPKFTNLRQSATSAAVIKNTIDGAQNAVSSAVNMRELENNTTYKLENVMLITGKGWKYFSNKADGAYAYAESNASGEYNVSVVTLDKNNSIVNYKIECNNFADTTTQRKCEAYLDANTTDVNLSI